MSIEIDIGAVVLKALNALVLPGVTINENSLVAVNSVVLHDIPPNTIAKSSLARVRTI